MAVYIHERDDWWRFRYDADAVMTPLAGVRSSQGLLLGRMSALGFSEQNKAALESLSLDILKSNEIEGEFLPLDHFHNSQLSKEEINAEVDDMLGTFDDETGHGRLYINHPMVESIRYVKGIPDSGYKDYTVSRKECKDFKRMAGKFSCYGNLDFIMFKNNEKPSSDRRDEVRRNWDGLKDMNVCKANYIVSGNHSMPGDSQDIAQNLIFEAQKVKFIDVSDRVSILNAFPLFLFEYFGK